MLDDVHTAYAPLHAIDNRKFLLRKQVQFAVTTCFYGVLMIITESLSSFIVYWHGMAGIWFLLFFCGA